MNHKGWSLAPAILLFLLALAAPLPAGAQANWRTAGIVGGVLSLPSTGCNSGQSTWYDPEAFFFPDGARGFMAQGVQPNPCTPWDALYVAKFNTSTLQWQLPAANTCPTLAGRYADTLSCDRPDLAPYQPLASPAIAKVGSRYFMAFSGGNADLRKGHVFWAYSDDGFNWIPWKWDPKPANYNWKPLIYPLYGDFCQRFFGISQLTLTYNSGDGMFYIHVQYLHRDTGEGDTYIFRFPYTTTNGFGVGGPMQICISSSFGSPCTWQNHSGAMVFDYDGQPPVTGDPLLTKHDGDSLNFPPGAGSIVWDPSHNYWLRVYTQVDGLLHWQSSTSLSSGLWSTPGSVDMTTFNNQVKTSYPQANVSAAAYGGLFWGTIGTRTGMWLFQPADYLGCGPFQGLGIFTVSLNYN